VKKTNDGGPVFREQAKALLAELDTHTGPDRLAEWNMKARALLTFEAIARMTAKAETPAGEDSRP
jgi:hypothetical protein